jgi:hypothetical protein
MLETNASIFLMKRPEKRAAWNRVTQIREKFLNLPSSDRGGRKWFIIFFDS